MNGVPDVTGPLEVVFWLAVLVANPGVCIVCGCWSGDRHPVHGPVHLKCVPRALEVFADDGPLPVRPSSAEGRRGAFSRRGAA